MVDSDGRDGRREALGRLVGDTLALLEYERAEGLRRVETDRAVAEALPRLPARGPAPRGSAAPGDGAAADPAADLAAVAAEIAGCTLCGLHRTRTRTVPGQGHARPELLFVGEGPGRDEDRQGLAFVGRAGQLLTRILHAMGLERDEVFIANIVKCRPTQDGAGQRDRPPTDGEMAVCLPYLKRQIAILRPRVIVTLGNTALRGLFGLTGITKLRGRWLTYEGIDTMPTYHPSFLLRGGGEGADRYWEVWDDMAGVLRRLGREPPEKRRKGRAP